MKYTIYHAQYRTRDLISVIENEPNKKQLENLEFCLKKLNQDFFDKISDSFDVTSAQEYRQIATMMYSQCHLLSKAKHRSQLKSICIALVCFAQKIEMVSDIFYLRKFQQKLEPLNHDSHTYGTTVLRPLSQQCSIYLAGHKGICALAAKAWLAGDFINYRSGTSETTSEHFIKKVEFSKEELYLLYDQEKRKLKSSLTFFTVTGLLRISNGLMLLALLDELSEHKNILFLINFAHFRNTLFHSVGCKFNQNIIQWFDSDCGIYEAQNKNDFGKWLDFYLDQNQYKNKFSFFTVQVGERTQGIGNILSNGLKYVRHSF